MSKETYEKFNSEQLRENTENLHGKIGKCEHIAKESGNYEKAYKELLAEIEEFSSNLNELSEIHFE